MRIVVGTATTKVADKIKCNRHEHTELPQDSVNRKYFCLSRWLLLLVLHTHNGSENQNSIQSSCSSIHLRQAQKNTSKYGCFEE